MPLVGCSGLLAGYRRLPVVRQRLETERVCGDEHPQVGHAVPAHGDAGVADGFAASLMRHVDRAGFRAATGV